MRTILTLCAIAALALFAALPASADVLTLTPSGTDWTISVTRPPGVDAIGGFDVDVSYNPLALTFSSVTFGSLLGDPTLFEALTIDPDATTPGLLLGLAEVSLLGNAVLAGMQPTTFDLATIHFTSAGTGAPGVALTRADVSDGFGNPVSPVSAVPEPGSWVLLLTAGAGIAASLRRRFA